MEGHSCKLDIEKAYDHMEWSFLLSHGENGVWGEVVKMDKVGENVDDLAGELGCKVGSFPSSYLGMPLGLLLTLWQLGMVLRDPQKNEIGEDSKGLFVEGGALERKPHSFSEVVTVCLDKSKGGWELRALLHSTRLFLANGRGVLQMKERLFGTRRFNDWELDEVENLLGRLCEERVMLERRKGEVVVSKDGVAKNELLCLGSFLEKSSNFRPNSEEGLGFSK
ncbi:hypothetical protein CK203_021941 [Vitis vinifera]|uniref:Reverse transcriptase domain-containing protein n=1 Tax=Vitis vinifera TaxID=29760 RepID=A0A438JFG2_VITVI|nr:hypothetical protein CK203_021941 [Vitis vinifera]